MVRGMGRSEFPFVTSVLAGSMLLVSLATLVAPDLGGALGGVGPLRSPWQLLTSVFVHGWPGLPALPHLAGNLALILIVGVAAERLLGSARYLALTALAVAAYAAIRVLSGVEVNGSSVFIWAYAPVVYLGLRRSAGGEVGGRAREALWGALVVMWGVVTVGMGALGVAGGLGPPRAMVLGNLYHIGGTLAGLLGLALWREVIGRGAREGRPPASPLDRMARWASLAVPVLLVLAWVALGEIAAR